jgi:hypothetical protein
LGNHYKFLQWAQIPQNAWEVTLENVTTPTHSRGYPGRQIAWLRVTWLGNHYKFLQWILQKKQERTCEVGRTTWDNVTIPTHSRGCAGRQIAWVKDYVVRQPLQVPAMGTDTTKCMGEDM